MRNIPKKIYLNHGLTNSEMDDVNFDELSEVTWSKDDTNGNDLEYVHISQLKEEREFTKSDMLEFGRKCFPSEASRIYGDDFCKKEIQKIFEKNYTNLKTK